jgi:predicted ATPase/class 3 adenylate cyclase
MRENSGQPFARASSWLELCSSADTTSRPGDVPMVRAKWARLDSNQGPTDYETAPRVSAGLGLSGETPFLRDFSAIRLTRISLGLGESCSHPVRTQTATPGRAHWPACLVSRPAASYAPYVSGSLPTGTVTMLFTDVEGSTRLLGELGDAEYADALREQQRLIRQTAAEHDGIEVDTQGDAFFFVFRSARSAVACAQGAQERLAKTSVRVRMGLHTGEALLVDGHYVGMDVHRAARIGAAGHGAQVLLSPTTVALLEPESFRLRDLGQHRLKDLSDPIRLYQLGPADFPPLKTLHRTNLPVPATPFLGRTRELGTVIRHATDPSVQLLTLTGPGGTGKTRLALQAAGELAEQFPGGVFWAPLAPLRDPRLVASAIMEALGFEHEGDNDSIDSLKSSIDSRTLLLVDNCEHLLDGVAVVVGRIVGALPDLQIVTTSREPLSLGGERVVPIDPLVRSDAVALFRTRAEAAGATLLDEDVVSTLCARLDDLPLAVELAAARAAALPPPLLLDRLSDRLDLLRGPRDADERQRTLRATISWSYDLLTPEEQRLFRQLSIFAGASTLDAIEAVAEADVNDLASLCAKSLVRMTPAPREPRYWQLETIREFANEQVIEAGEAESVGVRHVRWFASLAEEADAHQWEVDAAQWLELLEADLGNLRVAFAKAQMSDPEAAITLGSFLGHLHTLRGRYAEAEDVLEKAIGLTDDPLYASRLRRRLGYLLVRRKQMASAAAILAEAEEFLGLPGDHADESYWRAWFDVKVGQGNLHYWSADTVALGRVAEEMRPHLEDHATTKQRAEFLSLLLLNACRQERYVLSAASEEIARAAYVASQEAGDWDAEFQLGFALLWRGKIEEAELHLRAGRDDAQAVGDVLTEIRCLVYSSIARRKLGDLEGVQALDDEIAKLDDTYGYAGLVNGNRAWLAWRKGDAKTAEGCGNEALASLSATGPSGPGFFQWTARFPLLAVCFERDEFEAAARHAAAMLDETQQPLPPELESVLQDALDLGSRQAFSRALDLAKASGYV